jgi:hypothetical protein
MAQRYPQQPPQFLTPPHHKIQVQCVQALDLSALTLFQSVAHASAAQLALSWYLKQTSKQGNKNAIHDTHCI